VSRKGRGRRIGDKGVSVAGWLVQESDTFRVYCQPNLADAKRLPEACEALRRQLQETWFGKLLMSGRRVAISLCMPRLRDMSVNWAPAAAILWMRDCRY